MSGRVGSAVSCVVCHHCKTPGSLGRWAWLDPVQPALPSRTCPSPCNTIRASTTGEMEYRELDYNLSTGVLTQKLVLHSQNINLTPHDMSGFLHTSTPVPGWVQVVTSRRKTPPLA